MTSSCLGSYLQFVLNSATLSLSWGKSRGYSQLRGIQHKPQQSNICFSYTLSSQKTLKGKPARHQHPGHRTRPAWLPSGRGFGPLQAAHEASSGAPRPGCRQTPLFPGPTRAHRPLPRRRGSSPLPTPPRSPAPVPPPRPVARTHR